MKEIDSGKDKIKKEISEIKKQKIETFDDIAGSSDKPHRIETFDDIARSKSGIETFNDIARSLDSYRKSESPNDVIGSIDKNNGSEKRIDEILEKTDPHWKEADRRVAAAQKEFEKRGDWRREFSVDAGKEEHKNWQDEVIERETKDGRIKGIDYDLEPALTHPDGGKAYPDYVDYKKDIIVDRKPIGKGESEISITEKYAEQRKRHIEAYEYTTGRKVLCYVYSLYPSPKDIF